MRVARIEDTGHHDEHLDAASRTADRRAPAEFANALRVELRAAQAEALGVTLRGDEGRTAAPTRSALSSLIDSLQRDLLGLNSSGSHAEDVTTSRLVGAGAPTMRKDDPQGWRALARSIGDSVVGTGFGDLFERQIDHESGFSPDVVFGRRVSSAGAEGIAQLMPQYYPNVNRLDPNEALRVAANTMADYLRRYDGDVRKALAAYNAGPGRVSQLVAAYGSGWEAHLPGETRRYLAGIVGSTSPHLVGGAVAGAAGNGATTRLRPPISGDLTQDFHTHHRALDIGAPTGTPIRASADGRVVQVERLDTGYGYHIIIDHGGGLQTLYAHASEMYVRPGENVSRGQMIAAVGNTGRSTGPHIHYEVRVNGTAVDPLPYIQ